MKKLIELGSINPKHKTALIIRHGDRELIPTGEIGNEIPINELGRRNAVDFGGCIKNFHVNKIYTSPISRCVQTAESILEGLEKNINVLTTKCLGDPGLHINDEVVAGKFYLENGFDEMYKRFCNNETIPGVPTALELKKRMDLFINENTTEEGITIFITHDSLIAFYEYCLTGHIYTKENWVGYLRGITRII